ncbi:restriction endonuclease subunit S [Porphyromonas gingivalis]|uniref:restriction endonuclease subunit S n=1 Tax=Porphyromonas gingivalis TaxID=837 RepID=UPI00097B6251|nr:restriction endonuclease subunit S [Porphyromonas gingivalis]SJL33916.1 Type I restriction modification DNA specificity domain protein [Porphyromonas gingivalis]
MAKNHKIAKCPPLRFPQFNDEWKQTTLGEILAFETGYPFPSDSFNGEGNGVRLIKNRDLKTDDRIIYYEGEYDERYIVQNGDILIGMDGDFSPCLWKKGKALLNQRVGRINTNQNASRVFILYVLADSLKEIELKTSSTTVKHLSHKDVEKIKASLPSLAEQEKIASFLSLIDERIQSCSETITQMKSLRISFYRTISHQRKREWQNIFLRDILTERKENNSMHYDVYSVSVSRGIVNQIEHLGRSFAAKDTSHYNTVHFGDVVYTKSPTGRFPYGIVKQSRVKSAVAVSPLYGVYIPNNYYIGVVLNNFFESSVRTSNYLAPLIQKGAKNTMNITTQHFLDNKILLPTSSEEQKKMADYLILLDERIEVEEELLKQYEMQKKYLLRQMFI